MSDDKRAALLKEARVGTTDCGELTTAHRTSASVDTTPQPPSLAAADAQVQQLRDLLLSKAAPAASFTAISTTTTTTTASGECRDIVALRSVSIDADELDRITAVITALEPFERWAREEAAHYRDLSSALAQVGAPAVIAACLLTRRPRIIVKALRTLALMMGHPQSCSETLKAIRLLVAPDSEGASEEQHPLPLLLAEAVERAPGNEGVCVAAAEAAAALADAAKQFLFCSAVICADDFMEGSLVGAILGAIGLHPDSVGLLSAATHLFASVASLPRRAEAAKGANTEGNGDEEGKDTPPATPASVLFCHIGPLLSILLRALRVHWSSTAVKLHGLRFLHACTAYPQNVPALLKVGAYPLAMRALRGAPASTKTSTIASDGWEILSSAASVACAFPGALDGFQRRGYVMALRHMLAGSGELMVVRMGLAMLYSLLRTARGDAEQMTSPPSSSADTEVTPASPYGAHAMYAQPMENAAPAAATAVMLTASQHTNATAATQSKLSKLRESNTLTLLANSSDTWKYLHDCYVPQLVLNAHDYYTNELAKLTHEETSTGSDENSEENVIADCEDEDKDEREVMRSIVSLADRCLSMVMRAPPPFPPPA